MALPSDYNLFDLSTQKIDPLDIFEYRTKEYNPNIFFETETYKEISKSIKENSLTFITGNPLAGKTRIVYDTFLQLNSGHILIPDKNEEITEYFLPTDIKNIIVFLDDVDDYCYNGNPALNKLLKYVIFNKIKCVITCRTGPEFNRFRKYIHRHAFPYLTTNQFHISPIKRTDENFIKFCDENKGGFKSSLQSFDGNIGSVMLPLDDMRLRFDLLMENNNNDKPLAILLGLKLHFHFSNYERNKSTFAEDKIRFFCNRYLEEELTDSEWNSAKQVLLSDDVSLNFIESEEFIYIEEAYLDFLKDSKGNVNDVVHKHFNQNALYRLFQKHYKPEEKSAYGFPMKTRDFNDLIRLAPNFEEAKKIFDKILPPLYKDSYSYTNLINQTTDTTEIIALYTTMKSKGIDTLFAPHNNFIGKFDNFKDLFDVLLKLDTRILYSDNGSTRRLANLAKNSKKDSLKHLFDNIPQKDIYKKPSFNRILQVCCEDECDYNTYIKPSLYSLETLDYPLRKNIIKTIAKLKIKDVAKTLIEKYLINFDYYNESGNLEQDTSPINACNFYIKSLDFIEDISQEQKALTNLNRTISNNPNLLPTEKIQQILKRSHNFLKDNIEELKLITNTIYLKENLVFNELEFSDILNISDKIDSLLKKHYLPKNAFYKCRFSLTDINKRNILTERLKTNTNNGSDEKN